MKKNYGFTLIEVMIAMVIIAIAFTAILKATENCLAATSRLQARVVAHWVAAEILTAAQVGSLKLPIEHRDMTGETHMLGQLYQWKLTNQPTTNKHINYLTVSVTQNQQSLYTLTSSLLTMPNPATIPKAFRS